MSNQEIYIGSNYGHNSSIAIINDDGEIIFAGEEERYSFVKATDRFPEKVLIEYLNTNSYNINGWSEGWKVHKRLLHKGILSTLINGVINPEYIKRRFIKETKRYFDWWIYSRKWEGKLDVNINYVGHHYSHALSLLPWGLKSNSLVLVSDTTSEQESISLYFYNNNSEMKLIKKSLFPNSIGSIFHQMAYHLGYSERTGPGKLMALSAYGKPSWYSTMKELVNIKDGVFEISKEKYPRNKISNTWIEYANNFCDEKGFKDEILSKYLGKAKGKDLASSIQKLFEESTYKLIQQGLELIKENTGVYPSSVGLAGGSALNCQANGLIKRRLLSEYKISSICVSPWSEDGGTAIGAAVHQYKRNHPRGTVKVICTSFLGTDCHPFKAEKISQSGVINAVSLLLNLEVLALYDNKMEFGPRALGARCIITRADSIKMKNKLNILKNRPSFMPFAPVVLEEDFHLLFSDQGSTNMAWTVPFTKKGKEVLQGAQHPSDETRVQVVTATCKCHLLREILQKMKAETGYGVLLLTSLNNKNEPIARNLSGVQRACNNLGINHIITRKGLLK